MPQSETEGFLSPCRKKGEEEIDPEQARKDLERLEMTRKKRCVLTICCTMPRRKCCIQSISALACHVIVWGV